MEGIIRLGGPSFPPSRPWSGLGGLLASSVGHLHSLICTPAVLYRKGLSAHPCSFPRVPGPFLGQEGQVGTPPESANPEPGLSRAAGAEGEDVSLMNTVQCFRIIGVFWSLPLGLGLPLGRTARKISCTWIRFTHIPPPPPLMLRSAHSSSHTHTHHPAAH